ncbi:MAG: M48 family metalloprotease [Proteobacteria bacterium]|nr:M48 family metalloprotease [Pseudomonadota bacterium]MBI3497874.1 M48 family metalloprotease [Pseudomonadota bacterium]
MSAAELTNTDFDRAIARNKRNTIILIGGLALISGVLGYVLGWAWGAIDDLMSMSNADYVRLTAAEIALDLFRLPPRSQALVGAAILIAFGVGWGLITLIAGAWMLAAFVGARPADPNNPAERQFINVVEEMAIAAGLPMPRAMIVDTPALNAFASGASPARAVITATAGLITALTREELQGVIGHEMGHVADYDVRYSTVTAAMAGIAVLVQHTLLDLMRWSPVPSRRRDRDSRGGLILVVMAIVVVVAVLAALAAKLVQFAISRQREYLADATSVKFTRNPVGLIHALERLQQSDTALARPDSPVAALCIAGPSRMALVEAFATHPPIEDRIQRLRNLGGAAEVPPHAGGSVPPSPPPRHGPWG